MAIEIVIENGSGVVGANSYIALDSLKKYLSDRNALGALTDEELKAHIISATDFIETFFFKGTKSAKSQPLLWPRSGSELDALSIAPNEIPSALIKACFVSAKLSASGFDFNAPLVPSEFVVEDKTGPLTTKFANPFAFGASSATLDMMAPRFPEVTLLLTPLLANGGTGDFTLSSMRA